jgi:hypothetical protein
MSKNKCSMITPSDYQIILETIKIYRIILLIKISIIKTTYYFLCESACYNYSRNTFNSLRNVRYIDDKK